VTPLWQRKRVTIFSSSLILEPACRDSVVRIVTGYGLDNQGVGIRVTVGARILTSISHRDRLWGTPSLLFNGHQGLFPRGESGRGVKLTTHLQLVPRLGIHGSIHPLHHTSSCRSAQLVKNEGNLPAFVRSYCRMLQKKRPWIISSVFYPHKESG
jgi:hypothetical protein